MRINLQKEYQTILKLTNYTLLNLENISPDTRNQVPKSINYIYQFFFVPVSDKTNSYVNELGKNDSKTALY